LTGKPEARGVAVALAYRAGQSAPQVVAKGRGLVAETIIKEARTHGVYVHESPELVSLLMQIDLDQHIPPQLYLAVAELLAWLYKLEEGLTHPAPKQLEPPRP
jgi:flagellar biosynthesis protein